MPSGRATRLRRRGRAGRTQRQQHAGTPPPPRRVHSAPLHPSGPTPATRPLFLSYTSTRVDARVRTVSGCPEVSGRRQSVRIKPAPAHSWRVCVCCVCASKSQIETRHEIMSARTQAAAGRHTRPRCGSDLGRHSAAVAQRSGWAACGDPHACGGVGGCGCVVGKVRKLQFFNGHRAAFTAAVVKNEWCGRRQLTGHRH